MEKSTEQFYKVIEHVDSDTKDVLEKIDKNLVSKVEEIRLRIGKPLMIYAEGKDLYLNKEGNAISDKESEKESYIVNSESLSKTFQIISNYSIYSIQEELKQGFITIKGGHRIGLIGKAIYSGDKLANIKNISSINIRISREIIGVSDKIMKYIIKNEKDIYNTLIVSPPKCGKTTILRDAIRNISNGIGRYNSKGLKVAVVDERSEIAGMYNGQPQHDLGDRTDVLDSCYKYDGMMILLRSMSPDVIVTDEIGHEMDLKAIYEAIKSGVKVISTAHGESLEDIKNKMNLKEIVANKVFKRIIILDNSKGIGTIKDVIDGESFRSII